MTKPLLSIGIIFKNEIRCLERCLKSLQPLRDAAPCEVAMADTGSDDGSRAVAEKYADILIDFPWIGDFAAARNAVLDRSTGEWLMTLDADEWFDPNIDKLMEFLRLPQKQYHLAPYTIRNFKTPNVTDDGNYNDFSAMRIMRLSSGTRYTGCIHEHWKFPAECTDHTVIRLEKTVVYHDGYAFISLEDTQVKHDRVAYYAYAKCWDDHDIEEVIRWSELYRAGIADYRSGNFDWNESFQGTVELASPYWERRLLVMLVEAYLRVGMYSKAYDTFVCINGTELDDLQKVEICVNMLLRLHRMADLDTETLMARFWEQINQPKPSEDMAEKRRGAFINTAAAALTPRYREDEAGREGFRRHGYTALILLEMARRFWRFQTPRSWKDGWQS